MIVAPMLATAALVTGCAATDDLMTSVALPATDAVGPPHDQAAAAPPVGPGLSSGEPGKLVVNGQERAYLDALGAAGVRPSSELLALSIGSYVCQARAAHQSPHAIWDYVYPLVHSDVRNANLSAMAPTDKDIDAATGSYIRIATERLC